MADAHCYDDMSMYYTIQDHRIGHLCQNGVTLLIRACIRLWHNGAVIGVLVANSIIIFVYTGSTLSRPQRGLKLVM